MASCSANDCLVHIWRLDSAKRTSGLKLITKIFSNVIANPKEEKYKDLNFTKIATKLEAFEPFVDLLIIGGFVISPNGERLYFDDEKMKDLLELNKVIEVAINTNGSNLQPPEQEMLSNHNNSNSNSNTNTSTNTNTMDECDDHKMEESEEQKVDDFKESK